MSRVIVHRTKLDGVLLIEPPTRFEDLRGTYVELYNENLYREAGITDIFVQDDCSVSRRHVLRGIHGDNKTTKLISCLSGTIYVIVVNNDPASYQFRDWASFTLSDKSKIQLYIPPKIGNSYLVMSDHAVYYYKQTTNYDGSAQFTIKWNDPTYNFYWPIKNPILSERDA